MGVRVQLSTHLSARVVYTTDTPTSLYCMDTPASLYDGGAYTGGCILAIGIYMGIYIAQCMHAYGEAHTEGCARTPISMTHLKIQGRACACNCQRICVPVPYILWIPLPPCRDGAREGRRALQPHEVRAGERRQALEELDGLGVAQVRLVEPVL